MSAHSSEADLHYRSALCCFSPRDTKRCRSGEFYCIAKPPLHPA